MKTWGFEKKYIDKKTRFLNFWKGTVIFIVLFSFFSFFSFLNETVYADKTNILKKIEKLKNLDYLHQKHIPSILAKFILDYKAWKNILKDKKAIIYLENKLDLLINISGYGALKKDIKYIYNQFKIYQNDIFDILWEKQKRNYLVIFANTDEERPDSGFFGSYAEVSFSGGHLVDFHIYDSYKVLFDTCKVHSLNWYQECDRKKLRYYHNNKKFNKLFKYTSFISSNFFGFTDLNAKNIIHIYEKTYHKKIDGVIFVKSDILKYLLVDGEKTLWKMEVMNYKNLQLRRSWKLKQAIKTQYLNFTKNLIQKNKKTMIKNFIRNYKKIVSNGYIRVYLPFVSQKFQNYLKENNFVFYNDKKSAYLFFYNIGNNKNSKFVDHITEVNEKIYVNEIKFPLKKWKNIIKWKNVFNDNDDYYKFLEREKVDKSSFLWAKNIIYKDLLIVPDNCKKRKLWERYYEIECK